MGNGKSTADGNSISASAEQGERIASATLGENDEESGAASRNGNSGDVGTGNGADKSTGNGGTGEGTGAGDVSGKSERKAKADNNGSLDPVSLAGEASIYQTDENGNIKYSSKTGQPLKKRGRKPGSSNANNSANFNSSTNSNSGTKSNRAGSAKFNGVEMLAAQFQILNTGIAFLTKFDAFQLDDTEALQMAKATANVMEQFDYVPDPKVAAVLGLVTTTGMIYGPRVYLYKRELENRAKEKRQAKERSADEAASTGLNFNYTDLPLGNGVN